MQTADGQVVTIGGKATLNFDGSGIGNLDFPLKPGDPRLEKLTSGGNIIETFEFKSHTVNRRSADIALLRVAYLTAFSQLGYGYVLNSGLNAIRQQIVNPTGQALPRLGFLRDTGLPVGLFIVVEPKNLKALLVEFDMRVGKKVRRASVILPPPKGDSSKLYEEYFLTSGSKCKYYGMPAANCVDNEAMAMRAFDLWEKI
jgi:hypothetical protein